MLVSFADGQLDTSDRELVLTLLDMDTDLSREVWELRKLKDMVDLSYQDLPELLTPLPDAPHRHLAPALSIAALVFLAGLLLLATGLLPFPGA
jgi:hypothetical protein